jgi:dihydroorotase
MPHFDLVLLNGEAMVPTNKGLFLQTLNIGVKDGKIAAMTSSAITGTEVLECKGLTILPGVIDSQVHFREPGLTQKEDLETGTKGALLGGVTSIFEMPNTVPATTTAPLFQDKVQMAKGRAWSNFAFYIGGSPENISELSKLETLQGCPGIKVFMGSSTGSLLIEDDEHLEKLFASGKRRVILHSEDEPLLRERKKIALEAKHPRAHSDWRSVETAVKSTTRLLGLSEKTNRPVHVLHVTTAEETELLAKAKRLATCEVTPQHLTLSAPECYERLGTYAQMNPPIREERHREALWLALSRGVFDVIGSDHAPHTHEEKRRPYPESPSGMPGVQTLLPIMLNHVNEGRLSLNRLAELVCENPRRVFGCVTKGRIEVGLDADFTIVDLKKKDSIKNSEMACRSGWTPFEGMKIQGWPIHAVVGGNISLRDRKVQGSPLGTLIDFK